MDSREAGGCAWARRPGCSEVWADPEVAVDASPA